LQEEHLRQKGKKMLAGIRPSKYLIKVSGAHFYENNE
jgi:hypothetical protein